MGQIVGEVLRQLTEEKFIVKVHYYFAWLLFQGCLAMLMLTFELKSKVYNVMNKVPLPQGNEQCRQQCW